MARIQTTEVKMKNGQRLTIRSAEPSEAAQYLDALRRSVIQNDGQVMEPDEWNKSIEDVAKQIQGALDSSSDLLVLAESDGKILGDLSVKAGNRKRIAHTCEFGISIIPEARGLGVGKLLMEALLDWAKKHPVIEKINLRVLGNNTKAQALYEKMGFVRDGLKRGELKFSDGSYVDDIAMSLWVKAKDVRERS